MPFFIDMAGEIVLRNESEITFSNSPSPAMERGLGGEVEGQVIKDRFLNDHDWLSFFLTMKIGIHFYGK